MLVDTDVLIWHLRGYPNATQRLDEPLIFPNSMNARQRPFLRRAEAVLDP